MWIAGLSGVGIHDPRGPGQMSVMGMLRQPPMGRVREVTSPSHSPSIGISNDEYSLKEKAPGATSLGRDAEILIAL